MVSQDDVRAAGGGDLLDRLAAAGTREEINEIILAIKELLARQQKPVDGPPDKQGEK